MEACATITGITFSVLRGGSGCVDGRQNAPPCTCSRASHASYPLHPAGGALSGKLWHCQTPVERSYWTQLVYQREERKLVRVLRNISVLPIIKGIKQL